MGAKQRAYYRIIVADSRSARDGKFIESIGTYDPIKVPAIITIDEDKALRWLGNGAQPTDTVRNILSDYGIMKKFADSKIKPKKQKKEVEVQEVPKKATPKKKTTTKKKVETKKSGK